LLGVCRPIGWRFCAGFCGDSSACAAVLPLAGTARISRTTICWTRPGASARVGWRPGRGDYRERRKEGKVWYGAGKLPEVEGVGG
jgi:hypothetical protein